MSGMVVDQTGMKVHLKFGHSRLNSYRDIRLSHFVTNNDDDNDDVGRRTLWTKRRSDGAHMSERDLNNYINM